MNQSVTRNDWVGRVIDGRFPLLEWLGGSERAGVFRTELKGPQPQRAAIRLIPADAGNPQSQIDLWASAAKISHPHLMRIFESGRAQAGGVDVLYLVTEFAEETLAEAIPERPLSFSEAGELLNPVLDALSYIHAKGFVYGHLKPANIMVVENRLKLPVDGVYPAGFRKPNAQLTIYDAPEIANGVLSPPADIWSLGVLLVESLTQHPPLWDRSTHRDPVVPAEVPQPFGDMARECLRYEAPQRATIRAIEALLDPTSSEPANEMDQIAPSRRALAADEDRESTRSRRVPVLIAAALVLVAVVAFLLMRSHHSQSSAPAVISAPAVTQPRAAATTPVPAPYPLPPGPTTEGATVKGAVANREMPEIPSSAIRTIRGTVKVKVRLNVDSNGVVSGASFDSRGNSRYFADKALQAARKWTFRPAQLNGRAVASVWMVTFEFRRSGPDVSAVEVSP